jgi:hypothetical protein
MSEGSRRCEDLGSRGRTASNIFGQQTLQNHGNRLYSIENDLNDESGRKSISGREEEGGRREEEEDSFARSWSFPATTFGVARLSAWQKSEERKGFANYKNFSMRMLRTSSS